MKVKMISDTAARVQVKGEVLATIEREQDKHCGGSVPVSVNGCWLRKGAGGWVTICAFGSGGAAERALLRDLLALEEIAD